jgi:hypothetical protein
MAQREILLGSFSKLQKNINRKFAAVHIFHFLSGTSMFPPTSLPIIYTNTTSPLYKTYAYRSGGGFPGGSSSLPKLLPCQG